MSTTIPAPTAGGATASDLYAVVDPGRVDRIDEAGLVLSATAVLGVICGVLINWLGWLAGGALALLLYVVAARLAWTVGVGGSS